MPPDGKIITCELDPAHIELARRHIAASPYADRIEIREGPALETIATLDGPFDFVFIDADKGSYLDYYEATLPEARAAWLARRRQHPLERQGDSTPSDQSPSTDRRSGVSTTMSGRIPASSVSS